MKRDVVLRKIQDDSDGLKRFYVASLAVFGSVARGEDVAGSDIDILVEFTEPVGMFTFVRLKNHLEALLGSEVDLVTCDALKDSFREKIVKEAIRAA